MGKLISDSGATKSKWVYQDTENTIRFECKGIRFGSTSNFDIIKVFLEVAEKLKDKTIDEIQFYGSGCHHEKARKKMTEILQACFPKAQIDVAGDIHAACLAALGDKPGFCIILGTGSVGMEWDGKQVVEIYGGKGFPKGDFAGGAELGLRFYHFLKKNSDQYQKFYSALEKLPKSPENLHAAQFGELGKILIEQKKNPEMKRLITKSIEKFIKDMPDLSSFKRIGIVGSVGFYIEREIRETLNLPQAELVFIKSPLDYLL